MGFVDENPFTSLLTILGGIIGLLLPSGLTVLSSIDYSQASTDPAGFLTGYVIAVPIIMGVEILSGMIGGLLGAIVGMVLDSKNYSGGYY
jgi:hypothetical protein